MSNISTGAINTNYPSPGVNNSSQGLRDNFTSISTNLDVAATEITDLQSKVLVKSALNGTSMDNDMNNGVIANVQTLSFRASTYNLGTNLSGTVTIDCTLGDVQYGTIDVPTSGDGAILLAFSKWAPADTRGQVEMILTVEPGQTINIPSNVTYGVDTIEGYQYNGGYPKIVVPTGVTRVHYVFNTIDCGETIEMMPVDRPRQTTQIKWGTPYQIVTGTITLTNGSNVVTGNGTKFSDELANGVTLRYANTDIIATIAANGITSGNNTSLTLTANYTNANLTQGNVIFYSSKGTNGDQKGDLMTDGGNLYICTDNWTANTNIWTQTVLGSKNWIR